MITLKQSDMHGYQHRMVDWILSNQNSALWAEPGLGKTVAALTAIKKLKSDFEIDRSLIIAPLRVSRSVWPKEIQRWEHLQDMTCENIYWPDAEENTATYAQINREGLQPDDRDSTEQRIKKLKRRDVGVPGRHGEAWRNCERVITYRYFGAPLPFHHLSFDIRNVANLHTPLLAFGLEFDWHDSCPEHFADVLTDDTEVASGLARKDLR